MRQGSSSGDSCDDGPDLFDASASQRNAGYLVCLRRLLASTMEMDKKKWTMTKTNENYD